MELQDRNKNGHQKEIEAKDYNMTGTRGNPLQDL